MVKGLVIIGYQGIGKSTIAGKMGGCIDLESGNFWIGEHRSDDWYIPYCQTALSIANQGYTVLTSSHAVVVDFMKSVPLPENVASVVVMCPSRTMKDEWIKRLAERYHKTGLHKDYKALMNAIDRFDENIVELCGCGLPVYQFNTMDYDLGGYIDMAEIKYCR